MNFPKLMGILNVTPDSFSDGGDISADAMLTKALSLLEDGADIIDVGAESTRPGATPMTAEEEWQRLALILPRIISTSHQKKRQVSLDTRHPENAAKAILLDVDMINDVSGCTNPSMLRVLADSDCDVICMHSLTIPTEKHITIDESIDVVEEIKRFMAQQAEKMHQSNIAKERIIFDPGIGFAKTSEQSIELLKRASDLKTLGHRLLIGHSRKSFLAEFSNNSPDQRDALTLAVSQYLLTHEVALLRVHNIKLHHELFELVKRFHA